MPKDIEKKDLLSKDQKKEDEPAAASAETESGQKEELEPVITREEFAALEKKEQKKKFFGFLNNKKDNKTGSQFRTDDRQTNTQELEKKLNDVLLKVEKLEGKFEMMGSSKSEVSERIANLAEEIGELRSMIFSREDTYSGIESEFDKIKEATAHMKPEKIHMEMEEHEKEVLKTQAQLEFQKNKIVQLEKVQVKITKLLNRFKSFENLIDISKDIKNQVEKIKDSEKYTSRMAAKSEKIFAELDNRLQEFQKYKKEVADINEMTKDLIRSNDSLEVKMDSLMSKDSFTKIREEQDSKSHELDTRIKILKDIVRTLVDKLPKENHDLLSNNELEQMRSEIHTDLRKESLKDISELEKNIRSFSGTISSLQNNTKALQSRIDELSRPSSKELRDPNPINRDPINKIKQSNAMTEASPDPIVAPRDDSVIQQFPDDLSNGLRPPQISNPEPSVTKETMSPEIPPTQPIPQKLSHAKNHIEKIKGIFKKRSLNQGQPPIDRARLAENASQDPSPQKNSDMNEMNNLKENLKGSIEQNKMQIADLNENISHLKSLYHKKDNYLIKEKEQGKDIFKQRIILDNVSLDLSMAELDILDGNEAQSRQKIDKVSTILENI